MPLLLPNKTILPPSPAISIAVFIASGFPVASITTSAFISLIFSFASSSHNAIPLDSPNKTNFFWVAAIQITSPPKPRARTVAKRPITP